MKVLIAFYVIFEGSSGNAVNPVPSHGSSPSAEIPDAAHKGTTVPASPEPPQRPQAQAAPQVISVIVTPTPEPIPAPPDPFTAPPRMRSIGRQKKVSSRMRESMEAGEFQISIFNRFRSTYETQHYLVLEL